MTRNEIKIKFEMKPFDFDNVRYKIGPFHDDDIEQNIKCDIIEAMEFSPFGGIFDYVYEQDGFDEYLIINHRISYELEEIIKNILGQEEDE